MWTYDKLAEARDLILYLDRCREQFKELDTWYRFEGFDIDYISDEDVPWNVIRDTSRNLHYSFNRKHLEDRLRTCILAGITFDELKMDYESKFKWACWYNRMLNDRDNLRKVFGVQSI